MNNEKRCALIVEDEPPICRICQKTLVAEGFVADIAVNGLDGREKADSERYDLCLSDIRTPGMNGIEFYRHLEKSHPELAQKVIFTTGDVLSESIAGFLEETGRPFLAKPFAPDQLRVLVRTI